MRGDIEIPVNQLVPPLNRALTYMDDWYTEANQVLRNPNWMKFCEVSAAIRINLGDPHEFIFRSR
jgi:hypothetical protein